MLPTIFRSGGRPFAFLLAALVFGLTLTCMGRAYAVTTTPNAAQIRYNLSVSGEVVIPVPAIDMPVHVMATCDEVGTRGIAFAEVMRASAAPAMLVWTGQ